MESLDQPISTFTCPNRYPKDIVFLDDDRLITCDNLVIRIWDVNRGLELKQISDIHSKRINCVLPLKNGLLASGSKDGIVCIYTIFTEKYLLRHHKQSVVAITSLEQGNILVSGAIDGTIKVWAVDTGKLLHHITLPYAIQKLEVLGSDMLLAGDAQGGIWCWKLNREPTPDQPMFLLQWATHPILDCKNVSLENVLRLSDENRRLLTQHRFDL